MNTEWNKTEQMPYNGDFIVVHSFCRFVEGWLFDRKDGVEYEEYVATYEPDDEDDHPVSREDYEFHRYQIKPMYSSGRTVFWEDVIEWLPLPEVR